MKGKVLKSFIIISSIISLIIVILIDVIFKLMQDYVWWQIGLAIMGLLIFYMIVGAINMIIHLKIQERN